MMKGRAILTSVLCLGLMVALAAGLSLAQGPGPHGGVDLKAAPLSTSFTYQGHLTDSGSPANGTYDFEFKLYDAVSGGTQVGSTVTKGDVVVFEGLFGVQLDFGSSAFTGDARWLEIGVRPGSSIGAYTTLSPRQALTPAPYALALPGLWTQQNATSPNIIGGHSSNSVTADVVGATIGGGGLSFAPNQVAGSYGTIGGGVSNIAATQAFIGGGVGNRASGPHAAIGGGLGNEAGGEAGFTTIGGGFGNEASGNWSTVSGGQYNTARSDYATIAGGGPSDPDDEATGNRVTDDYGTVGGGGNNQAGNANSDLTDAIYATIGGGEHNTASNRWATVSGGLLNTASGDVATVGGGYGSTASDYATVGGGIYNDASGRYATVGGGADNDASAWYATVGGGADNDASAEYATVGGGERNTASASHSTVGGGSFNMSSGENSTAGGGENNTASGIASTVGGGSFNTASGGGSTVDGGYSNRASGDLSTVGGGYLNTASGAYATIPGGSGNRADGDYSFAAGRGAKANSQGCFVWGDSTDADVTCNNNDQFIVRASGGVYFYTNGTLTSGVSVPAGGNAWSAVSDRNLKENFAPVDGQEVLARLAEVPVTAWNYKSQDPAVRHIGPVAQDFYAAFGLGEDDEHISTVDADGVALAAIQGLYQLVQEKEAQVASLRSQVASLRSQAASQQAEFDGLLQERDVQQKQITDLEKRLVALEQQSATRNPQSAIPWLLLAGVVVGSVWLAQRRGGSQ